jgi:hypothetical protein
MTVSLARGGEGLGAMWGEEKARQYPERAGFQSIEIRQLAHDARPVSSSVWQLSERHGGQVRD